MKRLLFCLIAIVGFFSVSVGQTYFEDVDHEWSFRMGDWSINGEMGKEIHFDSLGNLYVSGQIFGYYFDGNWVNSQALFIAKYDKDGNEVWTKYIEGLSSYNPYCMALSESGHIYISGYFSDTIDFDPSTGIADLAPYKAPYQDGFIAKYDTSGKYEWAINVGGNKWDNITSIGVDEDENVYATGYYVDTADFNPGPGTDQLISTYPGTEQVFVSKYDSSGSFLWVDQPFSNSFANSTSYLPQLELDSSSNAYVLFNYSGKDNMFLTKYHPSGSTSWYKTFIGKELVPIEMTTNSNSVYLTGSFTDSIQFDASNSNSTNYSNTNYNFFLAKFDTSGNYLWSNSIEQAESYDLVSDKENNIYLTGDFAVNGGVDFDPSPDSAILINGGIRRMFFCKYSGIDGSFIFAKGVGRGNVSGDYRVFGLSIDVNPIKEIGVTGQIRRSADFDPSYAGYQNIFTNSQDIYLAKYSPCLSSKDTVHVTECDTFIWPYNGWTYTASGFYTHVDSNANGCDSIITLDLTIKESTSSVVYQPSCDSFTFNNVTYYQSGTYYQNRTNAVGCDSTITLILDIHGTQGQDTLAACDSLVSPSGNKTWFSSGIYKDTLINAIGCDSVVTVYVTINSSPTLTILPVDSHVCYGDVVTLTATGADSIYWTGGSVNGQPFPAYNSYTPVVYGIDSSSGCSSMDSVQLNVHPYPNVTTSVNENSSCGGICDGSATLNVSNGTPPYSYQWGVAANYQTTAIANLLCGGWYGFSVSGSFGCTVSDSVFVPIQSIMDPQIYLTNIAAVDTGSVSPSFDAYYQYNLPNSIIPPSSNPRNLVDPGKKARFKVEAQNNKWNGQSIVSGICKVRSNSPYVEVTDSMSALNNIGWNGFAWSYDEFEIEIDPNTPAGTNVYIDFVVQENGNEYITSCIPIPVHPLDYSTINPSTIDDDNNPDSDGNNNDIVEPNETVEFYPWLDNKSDLDAEYVRGKLENLDNLSGIYIWDGDTGVNTVVYDATWWNYSFSQPQTISSGAMNTTPEYDFVFDYSGSSTLNSLDLHLVMAGGFDLFAGNALSLVQWSLPFSFNSTGGSSGIAEYEGGPRIEVYPNPTGDVFRIYAPKVDLRKIEIFDQLGNKVLATQNVHKAIDLSQHAPGLYMVRMKTNEKVYSSRLSLR